MSSLARVGWWGLAIIVGACVPVDTVEVPDGVDWVAAIGHAVGDLEEGRLYSAREVDALGAPTAPAWLVGYSQAQVEQVGVSDTLLRRSILRWAEPSERSLPDPEWSVALAGATRRRPITTEWLLLDPPEIIGTPQRSLRVDEIELRVPAGSGLYRSRIVVGSSDLGTPLVRLPGRMVARLTEDEVVLLGPHNCEDGVSIAEHQGVFWMTADRRLCTGTDVSALEVIDAPVIDRCRYCGVLQVDGRGNLWFVDADGRTALITFGFDGFDPPTSVSSVPEVKAFVGGALLAESQRGALTAWSFLQRYDGTKEDLFFWRAFAGVGDRVVYAAGATVYEAQPPNEERPQFATGTSSRDFESIIDMESYGGGILVLESTGHVSWVGQLGIGYDVTFFERKPTELVVVGRSFYGIHVSDRPNEDDQWVITFVRAREGQ